MESKPQRQSEPEDSGHQDPEEGFTWSPKPLSELTQADVQRLAAPALRIFHHVADAWQLNADQRRGLLGADSILGIEQIERVSLILGIYRNLHTVLPASADGWVHRPNSNPRFDGQSALALMISNGLDGIWLVRNHLEAWAQGE
ncbi:antitoxin Xre/MbcA/ParS toxin-binding domain-containing protein [Mesoterricola sediminis]|uniref:antitoxin Xre/MbcA/ParS toxin-binding domain-containing protein n=1 Tax=Mesoterricola sediminis TaxID=2927980 RepID=UPI00293106DA|nr:antitoxin Xre/MbcA/ParS toxin-binding domain-containing protein [Mesoterricola sediminis]